MSRFDRNTRTVGRSYRLVTFGAVLGLLGVLCGPRVSAQEGTTYAITGGTVHTVSGPTLQDATVLLRMGRIIAVGEDLPIPEDAERIDVSGLHVYPGLFNAFSQLGLQEINSVVETNDVMELGSFNPHLTAATAVHPASERIPVTRAAGVTHVVAAPSARPGGIGGQASAIHLEGWTIEQMLIRESVGTVLRWPTLSTRRCSPFGCFGPVRPFSEVKEQYDEQVDQLRSWLNDSRRYQQAEQAGARQRRDLRLEAMGPVLDGDRPILVIADQARDIRNAVAFAEEEGLQIVIVSGRDAPMEAALLAEKDVPVLLRATQTTPTNADDPYSQTFGAAAVLAQAGVRFGITGWASAGPNPPSRTIAQEAANAVKFGLSPEEALRAITLYPAQILGLGADLGAIEGGMMGNLIVTDGDPLQIRTQVLKVFVHGEPASLQNKHRMLYERYRVRN
jgi:imidazolonepropionase-like amidohydrolase